MRWAIRSLIVVISAFRAALSSDDQKALLATQSAINVAYMARDLKVTTNGAGQPVITGRLTKAGGTPPPAVGLLTYQLTGTVTDSNGKPVSGAHPQDPPRACRDSIRFRIPQRLQ